VPSGGRGAHRGGVRRPRRQLGRGVLEHLAPELADEAEYQRLLAEEARAAAATRLSLHLRGDGSTDIHARVPDHVATRLRTYLDAYTSPRRTPLGQSGEVDALPVARRRGEAFCALLENLPDTGLPTHGGTTTSVMVTLDLDTLLGGLGVATTSTGDRITAEQARRLACQARIIPSWSPPGPQSVAAAAGVVAERQGAWPRRPPTAATAGRAVRPTRRPSTAATPDAAAGGRDPSPAPRAPRPAQRPTTTTAPTTLLGRSTITRTARPASTDGRDRHGRLPRTTQLPDHSVVDEKVAAG
jgi:hypothetical protein